MFSLQVFDLLLLPPGQWTHFISWCEAPLHASNVSQKKSKKLLYCMLSLSIFWLDAAAPRTGDPFLFHGAKCPFMRAMQAIKISKHLLSFTDSLYIFWLAGAAPRAGVPVYFMVQSTPQCKQRKLINFKYLLYCILSLYCSWHAAAALRAGGLFISLCKTALHASNAN